MLINSAPVGAKFIVENMLDKITVDSQMDRMQLVDIHTYPSQRSCEGYNYPVLQTPKFYGMDQ